MDDRIKRLYEMFLRVLNFMTANTAAFQDVPFVAATVAALQAEIDKLAALGANKITTSAAAKDSTIFRGDARDALRDTLEDIAEVWRTVIDEVDGAQNKFRVPAGNNDQNMIAAGKSFAAELVEYEQIFHNQGLTTGFITDLEAKTAALEEAVGTAEAARGERVGTNAAFSEPARKGKRLVEKLAPAVKRKFRANPQKLAAWLVASHIERPAKSSKKSPNAAKKPSDDEPK